MKKPVRLNARRAREENSNGLDSQTAILLDHTPATHIDAHGSERRAAIYVGRLAALRFETFIVRCQLDNPRNECRRELLTTRLDATDARSADIHARMVEAAT